MRAHRTALLCLAAMLIMVSDGVFAQKMSGRGPSNAGMSRPQNVPDGPSKGGGGYPGGGQAARRQRMSAGSCPMKSSSRSPIQSAHNRSKRCSAGTG
jgi:hypothetical protein